MTDRSRRSLNRVCHRGNGLISVDTILFKILQKDSNFIDLDAKSSCIDFLLKFFRVVKCSPIETVGFQLNV